MQHTANHNNGLSKAVSVSLLTFALYMCLTSASHAQVGDTICFVWDLIHDDIGRGIATLAICAIGVGAMVGKVSWGMAITVAVGIAVLFNADTLALYLSGSSC